MSVEIKTSITGDGAYEKAHIELDRMFFICDEDDEVTIGLGGDDGRKNDTNIYIHLNPTDARAMAAILNSIADLADNEGGKGYNS